MSKRKRLFPKKYQADFIPTPRVDHNAATMYNRQRSQTTVGPRHDVEPKLENNFTQEIPITIEHSLRSRETGKLLKDKQGKTVRSERGKVVDTLKQYVEYDEMDLQELFVFLGKGHGIFKRNWFNIFTVEKIGDNFELMLVFRGNEFMYVQDYNDSRRISQIYIGHEAIRQAALNGINWQIVTKHTFDPLP